MPLAKIELRKKEFTFCDGQSVYLNEPTLGQIQNATKNAKGDEIEQAKILLIDMSLGELTKDFLNSCPQSEFIRLMEIINDFMSIEVKN